MHLQEEDALVRRPLEMKYTYPSTLSHVVSEYIRLWESFPKHQERLLVLHAPSEGRRPRKVPFGNEIYLSKYPESCSFRIYKVMGVQSQNPRSGCLFFMHLQEGDALERRPLEMKHTYPSTLSHVVSEYIRLWEFIPKTPGVVACFHAPSGGRLPREAPFGNEIYFSKYPVRCSSRI